MSSSSASAAPARPPVRVLTGLQPSGDLHLGNYYGAIRPLVQMQDRGQTLCFVADYHALTTVRDGAALRASTREVALGLLAGGVDPARTVLFRQSDVPEVCELSTLLGNVINTGLLERGHAYREKVEAGIPASVGLFTYPVLMAADILLYDATHVPVGRDQSQHLDVARDTARAFNAVYATGGAPVLTVPEAVIAPGVAVVPGLDGRKMSKSYGNTIPLGASDDAVRRLVMRIVTDSTPVDAPKPVEGSTILGLYALVATGAEHAAMVQRHRAGGEGYGVFKRELADLLVERTRELRDARRRLAADPGAVDAVLAEGARAARDLAAPVRARVRSAMGLG